VTSARNFRRGQIVVLLATCGYAFLILPSLIIIPVSFGNRVELVFPPTHYSLDLYRDYLGARDWIEVTWRSARTAFMAAVLALAVGVPAPMRWRAPTSRASASS
jgi:putative spermidine/putrescine transport system permease protein